MSQQCFILCTRLVGAARVNHPAHSCRPQPLRGPVQERPGRHLHMPRDWMLPAFRAHQGVRRIQERLQEGQWRVKQHRHPPAVHLPCLGAGAEVPVGTTAFGCSTPVPRDSIPCLFLVQMFPLW